MHFALLLSAWCSRRLGRIRSCLARAAKRRAIYSRIGAILLHRTQAAFPRHEMEQNSQSVRRASVAQRWLDLRRDSVVTCSCTLLSSQPFAIRLRWFRDRDQAEYKLQKYLAARATATPALASYVSRLVVAFVRDGRAYDCGECVIVARRSAHMLCKPHVINQRSPPSSSRTCSTL